MLKKVGLKIVTERRTLAGSLYDDAGVREAPREAPRRAESVLQGNYLDNGRSVSVTYTEGEQSDLAGSHVTLSFAKNAPETVSIKRGGSVRTALEFQTHTYCRGVYQTPVMPFDVCVYTEKVENGIGQTGVLFLDYVVELKGAEPERTQMQITVFDAAPTPRGKAGET